MSSSKTRVLSEIDLGEFERRLLAAHHVQRGTEDPLSELTRLVSTIAADRAAGAKVVALASPGPKPERPPSAPAPGSHPEPSYAAESEPPRPESKFAPQSGPSLAARREPTFALKPEPALEPEPPIAPPPEPVLSSEPEPAPELKFEPAPVHAQKAAAPISPRLERLRARVTGFGTDRESDPESAAEPRDAPPPLAPALHSAIVAAEPDSETTDDFAPPVVEYPRADRGARGKSWYLKVAGLAALGVAMAAGAVSMKLGVTGSTRPPPLILAAESPTKVAPPSEAAVQSPGDSGTLLLNDSATRAPAKIVTNEEVPVDLSAIVRESQPAPPAPAPQPPASATANVAEATPVPPTADTPVVAPTESLGAAPQAPPAPFPAAKHVKTVSVRPDGTLISVDAPVAAAPPQSAAAATAPAPEKVASTTAPMAATPTLDLPEKSTSKSSARVTASKTATTVPPDDEFNPPKPDAAAAPDKPAKLPTKLRPPKTAAESAAVVASNATPAAEAVGGGGWAVQLAAPRSEAEAQADVSRLKSKYADNLGDAPLAIHKAEVNGETIYRVRAGGLTKADAAALCAKLKASGGDCFVARN